MDGVTTDTSRNSLFPGSEQFAVDARVVLTLLIHAQRGIKSLHQVRITVAFATVSRNVDRSWFSEITFPWVFRSFTRICTRIAAMTIVAGKTAATMYIVFKEFGGTGKSRIVQPGMAVDAGILLLRRRLSEKRQEHERY